MIQIEGLTKAHGEGGARLLALKNVTMRVRPGEFVSVMGPSGSGKSTLLNMVSALDRPSAGRVTIEGQDISQLSDDQLTDFRCQKLGLVFQFFNLMQTLDTLDNVLLPVMLERPPSTADVERAHWLLEQVGLGKRAHHRTFELSGGEMQRVAIARALIRGPKLLLADEPTGNLDSATGTAILALLQNACQALGLTIVMVTHDRSAAEYGHRIVHLRDGAIVHEEATARMAQSGIHAM